MSSQTENVNTTDATVPTKTVSPKKTSPKREPKALSVELISSFKPDDDIEKKMKPYNILVLGTFLETLGINVVPEIVKGRSLKKPYIAAIAKIYEEESLKKETNQVEEPEKKNEVSHVIETAEEAPPSYEEEEGKEKEENDDVASVETTDEEEIIRRTAEYDDKSNTMKKLKALCKKREIDIPDDVKREEIISLLVEYDMA